MMLQHWSHCPLAAEAIVETLSAPSSQPQTRPNGQFATISFAELTNSSPVPELLPGLLCGPWLTLQWEEIQYAMDEGKASLGIWA
jgi:hypothetical protein